MAEVVATYAVPEPLVIRLGDAIERHVAPGMHLHFASTPSRSNAAIREVARAFLGTRPAFRLSSTGFHSMMHLLPALGLAERLTACFFGDHHPAPRPNPLYTRLADEGVLACGADNRCIAALGAAQIDRRGNLNSTRLGGKLLVGSGGACDIAASVEEVVVLARLPPGRLVDEVEYVTSSGRAVGSVVTDRAVLTRPRPRATWPGGPGDRGETWTIASLFAADPDQTVEQAIALLERDCPWPLVHAADLGFAAPITADEARLLDTLGEIPGEAGS